jgi:hypothetical protein
MEKLSPIHRHFHGVQFYGNEASLFTTVAGFLSEGLVTGQPAIVITTEAHRAPILRELSERFIDIEKAQRVGDLLWIEARKALSRFMVDDVPDSAAFDATVGEAIARMLEGRPPRTVIRAYGEMVDVLWKDGLEDSAIRLEILWNKLATRYGFALLCGYSMGNFYKQAARFEAVVQQHTHVDVPEPNVAVFERRREAR